MRKIIWLALAALMLGQPLPAQTLAPAGALQFHVDYARFRQDDKSGYLEVYYSFHPRLLTFTQQQGKFHAGIALSTRLLRAGAEQAVADKNMALHLAEADTAATWYRFPFVTQTGFVLPQGDYTLEVTAVDSLAPNRKVTAKAQVNIPAYGPAVMLSDLELCKKIAPSQNKADLFYKNALEVVPQPEPLFGVSTSPVLFYYAELYRLTPNTSYTIKTQIVDSDGKIVYEKPREQKYSGSSGMIVDNKMVTALPSGKYSLRCIVADQAGVELTKSEKTFFLLNPHVQVAALSGIEQMRKDFSALSEEELSAEFRTAQYLALAEEKKIFGQLTSADAKREFLAKFWADAEQGRADKPAIRRVEYLRRVKMANQEYSALGKEGWRTDRGRVFILYSKPDEIERYPAEVDSKAHEVWRYFSIEKGVEFVFIDRNGYGEYLLVHSTKRDELHDDLWERLLQ